MNSYTNISITDWKDKQRVMNYPKHEEFLKKYSGKITGYEHLDDGTGDYSKSPAGLEDGTDELVSNYKNVTPGEEKT